MIDVRIKSMFFDRAKVQRAVDKAKLKVLSRAGAFIRQTALTSIRKRKGTSPRGRPPYSHEGSLRQKIFFRYDEGTDSVVIGPELINFPTGAPHTLEFGGTTTIKRYVAAKDKWRTRKVRIAPRPFIGPAMKKELPKLPKLWANSVRG